MRAKPPSVSLLSARKVRKLPMDHLDESSVRPRLYGGKDADDACTSMSPRFSPSQKTSKALHDSAEAWSAMGRARVFWKATTSAFSSSILQTKMFTDLAIRFPSGALLGLCQAVAKTSQILWSICFISLTVRSRDVPFRIVSKAVW